MKYTVKNPILGFESLLECEIEQNDGATSILKTNCEDDLRLALMHHLSKDEEEQVYVSESVKALLDIKEDTNVSLYYVMVLDHKDIHNSTVNLASPILVNEDNKTLAQYHTQF